METELISQINLAVLKSKIHCIVFPPVYHFAQATHSTKQNAINFTEKTIIKQRWMVRLFYNYLVDSVLSHFLEITDQILSDFNFSFFQALAFEWMTM